MSDTLTQKKLLNQILSDLESDRETRVLEALSKVPEKGTEKVIPSLITVLEKDYSTLITEKTALILSELKSTAALPVLMKALPDASSRVREIILSAVWNSGLDASPYLSLIVNVAVKGSYMECLEVLTIIENTDSLPPESQILESLLLLREVLEKKEEEKTPLLRDMLKLVSRMEEAV